MVDTNVSEQAFPNETANYTSYQNGPQPSKTIQIAVFTLIMVLSLIGNFLIVAVFYTNRTLRTPINTFIVNMAIFDLIIPVITLPWKITTVYHDGLWLVGGVVGTVLCKLTRSSWSVSTFVSILSMIAIAVDRFHAVLFPIRLPLISLINCYIIIATTWVVSVASHAHYLYTAKLVTNDAGLVCEFQWEPASYTKEMEEITQLLLFCLTAISAIVLTVLYSSIIVYLYRQKNKLHLETDIVRERAKRNRKITLMLVIVVVFFYAVWIPYNVASFTLFVTPGITTLPDIFSGLRVGSSLCCILWQIPWCITYLTKNIVRVSGSCCVVDGAVKTSVVIICCQSSLMEGTMFMTPGKSTILLKMLNYSSDEEVTS